MKMLKENNGKYSSKRVIETVILFTLLVLFVYKEVINEFIQNMEIFISYLITAGTLLGITIITPSKEEKIEEN